MPRKNAIGLYVEVSASEKELLEAYCDRVGRTKSDVVRELIRSLMAEDTFSCIGCA